MPSDRWKRRPFNPWLYPTSTLTMSTPSGISIFWEACPPRKVSPKDISQEQGLYLPNLCSPPPGLQRGPQGVLWPSLKYTTAPSRRQPTRESIMVAGVTARQKHQFSHTETISSRWKITFTIWSLLLQQDCPVPAFQIIVLGFLVSLGHE